MRVFKKKGGRVVGLVRRSSEIWLGMGGTVPSQRGERDSQRTEWAGDWFTYSLEAGEWSSGDRTSFAHCNKHSQHQCEGKEGKERKKKKINAHQTIVDDQDAMSVSIAGSSRSPFGGDEQITLRSFLSPFVILFLLFLFFDASVILETRTVGR